MAAALTADQATVITDSLTRARQDAVYNGTVVPEDPTTLIADYIRLRAAIVLVQADPDYAGGGLATETKDAVDDCLGL